MAAGEVVAVHVAPVGGRWALRVFMGDGRSFDGRIIYSTFEAAMLACLRYSTMSSEDCLKALDIL